MPAHHDTLFKQNLELFGRHAPDWIETIRAVEPSRYTCLSNANRTPNLKYESEGVSLFVHSESDPFQEAQEWFLQCDVRQAKVLYIYGLGLGYSYRSIKSWLALDKKNMAIFLEDEPEVIRLFLESESAEEILKDEQVRVYPFSWPLEMNDKGIDFLTTALVFEPYEFSSSPFKIRSRPHICSELFSTISHMTHSKMLQAGEFIHHAQFFFHNFYRNILKLPLASQASSLTGKFTGIPAIICGAGPSLKNNIDLLKSLSDRALIIAGGTAINALNSKGIQPHFGVAIDPNEAQFMRLLANSAFEVPFFYRNRICTDALNLIHGDRLYITGTGGYRIADFFEEELGIDNQNRLDEGFNVTNFSLSIAKMLGCDPIIVVGVDLAYSEDHSYIPDIKFHPLQAKVTTKSKDEALLSYHDIFGRPVKTLWKWINESLWYGKFKQDNPAITVINSTEGGIGFRGIFNIPLSSVALMHLTKERDLEGLIFGEIQNAKLKCGVKKETILKSFEKLKASLLQCKRLCYLLVEQYEELLSGSVEEDALEHEAKNGSLAEIVKELEREVAFKYVLKDFLEHFDWIFSRRVKLLKGLSDSKELKRALKRHAADGYKFLIGVIEINHHHLISALSETDLVGESEKDETKKVASLTTQTSANHDNQTIEPHGIREAVFYPNGALKRESFNFYGRPNGPSRFYSEEGVLLSEIWYREGLKEGEAHFYFPDGSKAAVKRFRKGVPHGKQEYFYPQGSLKTSMSFTDGVLDGEVLLYYLGGTFKRKLAFKMGLREGEELLWNEAGTPIVEAHYLDDEFIGTASWWFDNGELRQKASYDQEQGKETARWDRSGKPISDPSRGEREYIEALIQRGDAYALMLKQMVDELEILFPVLELFKKEEIAKMRSEIASLRAELYHYDHTRRELEELKKHKEDLWSSSYLRKRIEQHLEILKRKVEEQMPALKGLLGKGGWRDDFEKMAK